MYGKTGEYVGTGSQIIGLHTFTQFSFYIY